MIPDSQDRELLKLLATEASRIRLEAYAALDDAMTAAERFSRAGDIHTARTLLAAIKKFVEAGARMLPEQSNTRKGDDEC